MCAVFKKTDGLDVLWKKEPFKLIQRDRVELSRFIDKCMSDQMITAKEISRKTGLTYYTVESIRLGDHSVDYEKLLKVLNYLGYDLVVKEAF